MNDTKETLEKECSKVYERIIELDSQLMNFEYLKTISYSHQELILMQKNNLLVYINILKLRINDLERKVLKDE